MSGRRIHFSGNHEWKSECPDYHGCRESGGHDSRNATIERNRARLDRRAMEGPAANTGTDTNHRPSLNHPITVLICGILMVFLSACSADNQSAYETTFAIGSTTRFIHDPSRNHDAVAEVDSGIRTPTTGVWYPLDHDEVIANTKATIPSSNLRIFKSC